MSAMQANDTVLSFSADKDLLERRESALRAVGYDVLSTTSETCVRFEIQMGQCGVLLLCYTVHEKIHGDLAELFETYCETGVIAFMMHPVMQEQSPHAHISFLDSELLHKAHLIRDFGIRHRKSA
jgi:hypothetical protein